MRTEGNIQQTFDSARNSMQRDHVIDRQGPDSTNGADSMARGAHGAHKPSKQEIRDFKALMQRDAKRAQGQNARQADSKMEHAPVAQPSTDAVAPQESDDGFERDPGLRQHAAGWLPHADVVSMQQMHAQALGAPPPAAAPPAPAPALAELIEKHVRQLLVSENATSASGGDVLLRMSDAALPGTDIWLRRTGRGWKVRADARSRDSYDAIVAGSERLVKRFAEQGLGELDIEPVYQGS